MFAGQRAGERVFGGDPRPASPLGYQRSGVLS